MQDGCEEIYPAVLRNTVHGNEAYIKPRDLITPFVGRFYGPRSQGQNGN